MQTSRLPEIVAATAELIGVSIVAADERFTVMFDEINECTFGRSDDGESIEFATPLCLVGLERESLFESALRTSLHGIATRGAVIALHSSGAFLELRFRHRPQRCDAHWLACTLAELLDTVRAIRRELHEMGRIAATGSHGPDVHVCLIRV